MRVEEKFPCLYCHDIFEDAEDYKNHLRHVHKVVKKLDEGVLAAKKTAGIPVICHFVEEITIPAAPALTHSLPPPIDFSPKHFKMFRQA